MTLPTGDIIQHLAQVPAVEKLKITVKRSVQCGAIVGSVTALSGILAGPVGLAIGGIVSSTLAAVVSRNKFCSAAHVILNETTPQEREKLAETVRAVLNSHHIRTVYDFALALKDNSSIEHLILQLLIQFLSSEMGRQVLM